MTQENIRVVAHFSAKFQQVATVKHILTELISPTRAEDGCITYELLQNTDNPTDLTFVEEWTSKDALDKHLATDHIRRCREQLEGLLENETDIRIYSLVR